MKRDLWEFFENDDGGLSMQRLLQFLAYIPATWALIAIGTENALLVYLGAFVLNTIANKGFDKWGKKNVARNTKRF